MYDLSTACPECKVGWTQRAPFRINKPPNWGGRSFFQLNWVFGSYFVKTEVYERVFRSAEVEHWPVLLYKKDTVVEGVVQLKASQIVDVDTKGLATEKCERCGRTKYNWPTRGFQPKVLTSTTAPLV